MNKIYWYEINLIVEGIIEIIKCVDRGRVVVFIYKDLGFEGLIRKL